MLLIFAEYDSPRLHYILKYFFGDLLNTEWEIVNAPELFRVHNGPKLNYSNKSFDHTFSIVPQGILFETDIKPIETEVFDFEGTKAFFRTSSPDFQFDIFGAGFYLISRYEEYLPFQADQHGRFEATQSLAGKHGFLHQPVLNIWGRSLKNALSSFFPSVSFIENSYSIIPTIDVDNVYAYMGKGFFRSAGAYLKSILKFDMKTLSERIKVHLGSRPDPFDCYREQEQISEKYKLKLIYFLLVGSRSRYDHNVSVKNNKYLALIKCLSAFANIGIHPSYQSNLEPFKMISEKQSLEKATGTKITKSRQHFLKMKLPETYRNLIKLEIKEDYSMGFASRPGFRAGTCTPFNFFDLELNKETNLKLFPFAFMDITYADYLNMNPKESLEEIKKLIDEVKNVGGMFIPVWHDRTFSHTHYPGWKEVFVEMIEIAQV